MATAGVLIEGGFRGTGSRGTGESRVSESAKMPAIGALASTCEVLPVEFYDRPVLDVARALIGCVVEYGGCAGKIVETEAYHESEPACHAFIGLTPRTRILFDEPGLAYVYRCYGIHTMLNAVCEPAGVGAAVLIRALEPLAGFEQMRARREGGRERGRLRDRDLCSGPGKLTEALGIALGENGTSLLDGPVTIRAMHALDALDDLDGRSSRRSPSARTRVVETTRIGITKAADLRWRFYAAGNPHVSVAADTDRKAPTNQAPKNQKIRNR
jgi:DNA-3-methyladenine glycosylase